MRFSIEIGRLRAVLVALVAALSLVGSSASAQETCVSCHSTQQDLRLRDPVERRPLEPARGEVAPGHVEDASAPGRVTGRHPDKMA